MIDKFNVEHVREMRYLTETGEDFVGLADKVNEVIEQLNREEEKERK